MKRIFALVLAAAMMLCAGSAMATDSYEHNAETYGKYTYTVDDGKAMITEYDMGTEMNIEIPSTLGGCPVTGIGLGAFDRCTGLTGVTIPRGVESIGHGAFYGCTGLTSVKIPNSVQSIGESAFFNCAGLTSVEIPNSVQSIGIMAFYGCTGLTSVEIPDSVTSITDRTFEGCEKLTSVKIPGSVTSIGEGAFLRCVALTGVEIPDSVTSIGKGAFSGCDALTGVEIPGSVTSIGDWAFCACGLTSVTFGGEAPAFGKEVFLNANRLTEIFVPHGKAADYEAAFKGLQSEAEQKLAELVVCAVHKAKICPADAAGDAAAGLPQTGDPSMLGAWVALLGASAAGLKLRRKK